MTLQVAMESDKMSQDYNLSCIALRLAAELFPDFARAQIALISSGIMSNVFRVTASDRTVVVKLIGQAVESVLEYQKLIFKRREAVYYNFVAQSGRSIPIPELYGYGSIPEKGIAQYLVMEDIGESTLSDVFQSMNQGTRTRICCALGNTLARIHSLPCEDILTESDTIISQNWATRFLSVFGDTVERLISINSQNQFLWKTCLEFAQVREPYLHRVEFLSVIHGDFCGKNIVLSKRQPNSCGDSFAVIDWEWTTIADAAMDFARINLAYIRQDQSRLYWLPKEERSFWKAYYSNSPNGEQDSAIERRQMYLLFYLLAPLAARLRLSRTSSMDEAILTETMMLAEQIVSGDVKCFPI